MVWRRPEKEKHPKSKEQNAQKGRPGKLSPACLLLLHPETFLNLPCFLSALYVLRIVCSPSVNQLTPTQASRTSPGVNSSRKAPLIPNFLLVLSWGSCNPSAPASSYHVILTIYILVSHLEGKACFWIITVCPVLAQSLALKNFCLVNGKQSE